MFSFVTLTVTITIQLICYHCIALHNVTAPGVVTTPGVVAFVRHFSFPALLLRLAEWMDRWIAAFHSIFLFRSLVISSFIDSSFFLLLLLLVISFLLFSCPSHFILDFFLSSSCHFFFFSSYYISFHFFASRGFGFLCNSKRVLTCLLASLFAPCCLGNDIVWL